MANKQPAFPHQILSRHDAERHGGMTIHDYFMAHAPITVEDAIKRICLLDNCQREDVCLEDICKAQAEMRKAYADEMMKVREM